MLAEFSTRQRPEILDPHIFTLNTPKNIPKIPEKYPQKYQKCPFGVFFLVFRGILEVFSGGPEFQAVGRFFGDFPVRS